MNKSISISLGGFAFFIEEDAYIQLQKYIDAVKNSLRADDDKAEIINDVETRIAELFKQYLSNTREVVHLNDVQNIINVLGTPEQINDLESESSSTNAYTAASNTRKKLYRDTDDKFIGGVCSGLAHYFGVDVLWIRIIGVILFFSGFASAFVFMPYIALLVLVPKANTVSEKLEMRGKPVTFDSIKSWSEIEKAGSKLGKNIENAVQSAGTFFSTVFGILFILISIGLIGGIITFTFFTDFIGLIPFEFYDSPWKKELALALAYFIILVPALSFLFSGIRLLNQKRILKLPPYVSTTLVVTWIIAIIVMINLSIFNYNFINKENIERKKTIELSEITSDTLTVSAIEYNNLIRFGGNVFSFGREIRERNIEGDSLVIKIKNEMEIIPSKDATYRMDITYASNAKINEDPSSLLNAIQYAFKIENNHLIMNAFLKVHKSNEFRNQDVRITLHVPENKYVNNKNISHFYFNHGNGWEDFWHNQNTVFKVSYNHFIPFR